MHGQSLAKTNSSHSSRKAVAFFFVQSHSRELRNRLRDDTQVLIKAIQQSIDLIQLARSSSATPALGYALSSHYFGIQI